MYTSGTTGRPKGVCVSHGPLLCRTAWMGRAYPIEVGDTVPFKTQFIFGISEWEIFYTLSHGATLAIVPLSIVRSPAMLSKSLVDHRASVAFLIPSHLEALLPFLTQPRTSWRRGHTSHSLRHIVVCGEALRPDTVRRFHTALGTRSHAKRVPDSEKVVQLHNLYGPTEGSMTYMACTDPEPAEVLIGRPIDDTVVLLLDGNLAPVPLGVGTRVPGEVCFGGAIAVGYLQQPELTVARFISNPLSDAMQRDKRVPLASCLYRSGDLAMRLPSGELRFMGRIDRQVKLRGYRIELEAIESVARTWWDASSNGHTVQLAATVVGGVELALYVNRAAILLGGGLLEHCARSLPPYMQPAVVLALDTLPALHTGKINLAALATAEVRASAVTVEVAKPTAAEAGGHKRFATDSLGTVRELNGGGTAPSVAREAAIADVLRAFLMYGVIMDHFAGCADGASCRLVMDDIVWRSPAEAQPTLVWLDTLVRMLGNYKSMAGFLMVSAYIDSGYRGATQWGRGDMVTLLTYLQIIWVLDPLMFAVCSAVDPERCSVDYFYFAGVHRWYLLAMLIYKAVLVVMRVARIPPLGQCVLLTVTAFTMPAEIGCLTDEQCESGATNDLDIWRGSLVCAADDPMYCVRQNDGLRTTLAPLWKAFFQGAFKDAHNMFSSIAMRYYFLFAIVYIWTFHFGRSSLVALTRLQAKLLGPRHHTHASKWLLRLCAVLSLVAVEFSQSAILGPWLYFYLQENYMGTHSPQLLPTLFMLVLLVLAILSCVAAIGADPRPPRIVRLMGSTTLGCYVIHMYLTFPLSHASRHIGELQERLGFEAGLVVQLLWLFGLPLLVQLTLGVLFHKLLVAEVRLLMLLLGRLYSGALMLACRLVFLLKPVRACVNVRVSLGHRRSTGPGRVSSEGSFSSPPASPPSPAESQQARFFF